MQLPQMIEVRGIRVLTTKQIAEAYGTEPERIKLNYRYNKGRFIEGKHIIPIQGQELREFKARYQFDTQFKYAKSLYLWTEKGALLHAKSLNTDKAWEVYDYLVDFYFRAKEEKSPQEFESKLVPVEKIQTQELPKINNPIRMLKVLLKVAEDSGIKVSSFPFEGVDSMIVDNHIGIRTEVTVEKACYELAWELSHAFIHYQKGDIINSPLSKDYNEQATRAADMVMKILNVKMSQM